MALLVKNGISTGWQNFASEGGNHQTTVVIGDNGGADLSGATINLEVRFKSPASGVEWSQAKRLKNTSDSEDILTDTILVSDMGVVAADEIRAVVTGGAAGLYVWTRTA